MKKQPYIIQKNKKTNTQKLKIRNIEIMDEYIEISLEHWEFKFPIILGTMFTENINIEFGYSNFNIFTREFREKWEKELFVFELIIPKEFIKKHNLNKFYYYNYDKYETNLIFKKKKTKTKECPDCKNSDLFFRHVMNKTPFKCKTCKGTGYINNKV